MKKYNLFFIGNVLLVSCLILASNSFAELRPYTMATVEGLTINEAEKKFGVESGNDHPIIFEINARSGPQNCQLIGPEGSEACPVAKIFYQSHLIPNNDGSSTLKVDIYFDNNEVTIKKAAPGNLSTWLAQR